MDSENKKNIPPPLQKGPIKPGGPPAIPGMPKIQPPSPPVLGKLPQASLPLPQQPRTGLPGIAPVAAPDGRAFELGKKVQESEQSKRHMENQIDDLQKQLLEEREKLLIQTVRAKEEEALASKVESSIKDMQEKLRRSKREQELSDQLAKAESQIKDLEKRISDERETWVATLKTQLSERDLQDKDIEHSFQQKIRDLERKWQDEQNAWNKTIRDRESEVTDLKNQMLRKEDEVGRSWERKVAETVSEKMRMDDDNRAMKGLILSKDKEVISLKAEVALVNSGILHEKERLDKYRMVLEKFKQDNDGLNKKITEREGDMHILKGQMSMLHTKYKSEIEKSSKEIELLKEKMVFLEHERDMLNQTFNVKEAELRKSLENNEHQMNSTRAEFESRFKDKNIEIQNLFNREREVLIKQAEDRLRIEALISQIENRNSAISDLRSEKNVLSEDNKRLQLEVSGLNREREALKEDIRKFNHEIDLSRQAFNSRENELKAAIESLKQSLSYTDTENQSGKKEIAQNKREIEELRAEIDRDIQLINDVKVERESISSQLESMKGQLETDKKRYESYIFELKENITALNLKKDELQGKVSELNSRIAELKSENELKEMKQKDLEDSLHNKESESHQLRAEIAKINELDHVKADIIAELKEQIRSIDSEVSKRVSDKENEFRKKMEYFGEINSVLQKQISERDKKIEEMMARELQLKEKYHEIMSKAEEEIDAERQRYNSLLSEKEREINELTSDKEKLEQHLNILTVSIAEREKQVLERDNTIEDIMKREMELKDKYREVVTKVEHEITIEKERYEMLIRDKENELKLMEENRDKLREHLDILTSSIADKMQEAQHQKNEIESLKKDNTAIQLELNLVETRITHEKDKYMKEISELNRQWEEKVILTRGRITTLEARIAQEKDNYSMQVAQLNKDWSDKLAQKERETSDLIDLEQNKDSAMQASEQHEIPADTGETPLKTDSFMPVKNAFSYLRSWLNKPMFKL